MLRADSIRPHNCGGRAADGSTASRPLQLVYPNRFLSGALPGGLGHQRMRTIPVALLFRWHCRPGRVLRFLSGALPGWVRASTYAYHARSIIVWRHCRPGRVLRFLGVALPGGLGRQRMRTIPVALLSGGTAAKKGSGECLTPLLCFLELSAAAGMTAGGIIVGIAARAGGFCFPGRAGNGAMQEHI